MNKALKVLGILAVVFSIVSIGLSQTAALRKLVAIPFAGSGTYTFATTTAGSLPGALNVDMTFIGTPAANTFTISTVRSNVTHILFTYAGTYKTVTYYVPTPYLFQTGDQLVWSNSVANAAVMTIGIGY